MLKCLKCNVQLVQIDQIDKAPISPGHLWECPTCGHLVLLDWQRLSLFGQSGV